MTLHVEAAGLLAVLLVATRIGTIFVLAPIFGSVNVPGQFRILLALGLSALLVAALGVGSVTAPSSLGGMISALASEFLIGGLLAFGLFAAFGAFLLGGRILDLQMGFGVASLIDPSTRTATPLIGTFLNLTAIAVFFAVDGHHLIIRGIAFSLEHLPPGTPFGEIQISTLVAQFGLMFVYAVALVAPALFTILLLDIGLAVVARTMPQVNIFIISFPLKIFVGLVTLGVSFNYLAPVLRRVFEAIFMYWQQMVAR